RYRLARHVSTLSPFSEPTTTAMTTLSLHDALPILRLARQARDGGRRGSLADDGGGFGAAPLDGLRGAGADGIDVRVRRPQDRHRSEEHTSELQSRGHLVCRLLLEKKKDPTSRFQSL